MKRAYRLAIIQILCGGLSALIGIGVLLARSESIDPRERAIFDARTSDLGWPITVFGVALVLGGSVVFLRGQIDHDR